MYNTMTIIGNLTRDIEIKYTQSGSAIASTAIASSHKYKTASGEQREEVMFMDLTFFGRSAEIANQYLRKGSKIFVEGRVKLDQWKDNQTGANRSKHVLIVNTMKMLDSKPQTEGGYQDNGYKQNQNPPAYQNNGTPNQNYNSHQKTAPAQNTITDIDEDEIPF